MQCTIPHRARLATPPLRMPRAGLRCSRACRAERCQPPDMAAATPQRSSADTAWWRENPNYNVAVATGPVSKVFVLDVDGLDAEASLRKLEEQHGALPETVESITPRGRHIFFRCENGVVRNSAGAIAPGLDIRGDGGYVVLPPSIHPSGRPYVWSVDSADHFAEAPAWLTNLLTAETNGSCQAQAKSPEHWHHVHNKHRQQWRPQQHTDEHLWEIATRGS